MSPEEAHQAHRAVVTRVRGRVPVIGGAIPDTTLEAVRLAKAAREAGVDALQITPPHYLFPPAPDDVIEYYRTIGRASGLPIIVYNVVPWATIDIPTHYSAWSNYPKSSVSSRAEATFINCRTCCM